MFQNNSLWTVKSARDCIEKMWPNAKALATSVSEQDGKTYPVAWINQYGSSGFIQIDHHS